VVSVSMEKIRFQWPALLLFLLTLTLKTDTVL
jgi:hypothetical protein